MKQKISSILFIAFVAVSAALGQTKSPARIIAGPMLGYSSHTECGIWVQVVNAKEITIQYRLVNDTGDWVKKDSPLFLN
jgi:hypothetical protein